MTARPSDAKRLARGIFANLVNVATRVTVQFAALPIFFASWPGDRIGSWMIAFAIPAYITLIGNGFSGAAGSAALAAAQAGDMPRARADFRVAGLVSLAGTGLFATLFALSGPWIAQSLSQALSGIPSGQLAPTFAWLGIYIFASGQISLLEIAFRLTGRYPENILLNTLGQLGEIVVIALCVTQSNSVAVLAMGLALLRIGFAVVSLAIAMRLCPGLFGRGAAALKPSLARLWRPSLGLMAVPLIFGLNLQGTLIVVGAFYGPLMLATFGATRTLTRLLDLFTNVIYGVQYYEAGYMADDRIDLRRRQLATMTMITLLVCAAFSAALLLTGPWVQSLYTLGQTRFDQAAAAVLLAAATIRALSSSPISIVTAENRHAAIVLIYLGGSALALGAAAVLARLGAPLPVALSTLILAEMSQAWPSFAAVLRRLDLSAAGFARLLLKRERLEDIAAMIRHLRHRG